MGNFLVKGLLVGLIFGVPAGAVGVLTIQRALSCGFWAGFLTGLGSSAADLLYACAGVFGLTVISDFLLKWELPISLVGGALIILMGVTVFRGKTRERTETKVKVDLSAYFASAFAVAIANPTTILSFLVAFASLGIGQVSTAAQGSQVVTGIFLGTGCWWCLLACIASRFRERITEKLYRNLNRILGVLLVLFGLVMALRAAF